MARTLGLFIKYEGSEDAKKRFLWELVYNEDERDEIQDDEPQGPDAFDDMDELISHVKERIEDDHLTIGLSGVSDIGVAEFSDGYIFIEAEDDDHYELLMEIADTTPDCISDNRDVTVEIALDGEMYCGLEHFKYQNGQFVEQWFENDRRETGVWTPCRISWTGPEDAGKALLEDIQRENEGCNLFEQEEQHWRGKRLHLDAYYEETGPYMRCAVCDGEIGTDHIGFDIYCNDFEEKDAIADMFAALAAAHPVLAFEMKMCNPGSFGDGFQWVKYFSYKNGDLAGERTSEDKNDEFETGSRDNYYRFSLPLDVEDTLGKGQDAVIDYLVSNNVYAIKFMPENALTPGVFLEAMQENGNALKYELKYRPQTAEFYLEGGAGEQQGASVCAGSPASAGQKGNAGLSDTPS